MKKLQNAFVIPRLTIIRKTQMMHFHRVRLLTLASILTVVACSSGSSDSSPATDPIPVIPTSVIDLTLYPADSAPLKPRIRRTTAGVPHIEGRSLAEVTAGLGYAQAEDNLCVLADGFIKVRGERAEFFGPKLGCGRLSRLI